MLPQLDIAEIFADKSNVKNQKIFIGADNYNIIKSLPGTKKYNLRLLKYSFKARVQSKSFYVG